VRAERAAPAALIRSVTDAHLARLADLTAAFLDGDALAL
jgi:hypothetical protein